ncbi:hypothetical protein CYLTODRAFT_434478 [Cylindrobasidium torrendii FP15055 ss-10]|uniref:Integral membrane protein S linking to the trans Golgi network-domain-containing protein n=1 Tax=Cylindrobasidium torrendii FP15055 ss-10 TaxID=1314674 RepID=A0A0D7BR34_9AGAR|nr:hypothetical protein CYLTODRAFT_434478 [Cylindrobasidium torrendii FP15055 ss-10]
MPPQKQAGSSTWDPVLILSQIISLQTIHYLALCVVIPASLATFADRESMDWEGGAASVGMILDWRNIAGRPTSSNSWARNGYAWVWSAGKKVGVGDDGADGWVVDPLRGWVISVCWLAACVADTYWIYTIVRRPRLVLDFALTFLFIHVLLTSYYSASFPTSLFWWGIMIVGTVGVVIAAEQLCVRREMDVGLEVNVDDLERDALERVENRVDSDDEDLENIEMRAISPRRD